MLKVRYSPLLLLHLSTLAGKKVFWVVVSSIPKISASPLKSSLRLQQIILNQLKTSHDCRPTSQFNTSQYFCFVAVGRDLRDLTQRIACAYGWSSNFYLYGGTDNTENTIKLYGYGDLASGKLSTNLFLQNDIDNTNLMRRTNLNVYVPGIVRLLRFLVAYGEHF